MADIEDFQKYVRMTTIAYFLAFEINTGEKHPRAGMADVLLIAKEISESEESNLKCVLYDLVSHIESEYAFWVRPEYIDFALR